MEKFQTELESQLWEMLYRLQTSFAITLLKKRNDGLEDEKDWPCGQEWNQLSGSSKAIFQREARDIAGIDSALYLDILRNNEDALCIAEEIYNMFDKNSIE